ncbi:MAG: hypothetical protein JXJ18_09915 [Rhodobacteraceae bacterium]|nr:hypothetical protein [Paracoccaceae bacterium]
MELVYHIGAHCTDDDRLLKCLLKNRGLLAKEGIVVPGPSRYRPVLREIMIALRGRPATAEMQQVILDATMDEDTAERLILFNQSFICVPQKVLDQHLLYPAAGEKSAWLAQLFPDNPCEFFLGLRNPATFIPALFAKSKEPSFEGFIAGIDPRVLTWSDMVRRIRNANPQARLTVWCNEDTPLIWSELLQEISGHAPDTTLRGTFDFLSTIMTPEGMTRMRAYLDSHPETDGAQRQRIVAAFLDKYAIPEEIEEELDLPGWTAELVDTLTERYAEDIFQIANMPGVHFIAP